MRSPTIITALPTIDYSALIGRIYQQHYTRRSLAAAIGVSEIALGGWIKRGELMHGSVIWAIASKLAISRDDLPRYFYQEAKR